MAKQIGYVVTQVMQSSTFLEESNHGSVGRSRFDQFDLCIRGGRREKSDFHLLYGIVNDRPVPGCTD